MWRRLQLRDGGRVSQPNTASGRLLLTEDQNPSLLDKTKDIRLKFTCIKKKLSNLFRVWRPLEASMLSLLLCFLLVSFCRLFRFSRNSSSRLTPQDGLSQLQLFSLVNFLWILSSHKKTFSIFYWCRQPDQTWETSWEKFWVWIQLCLKVFDYYSAWFIILN